MNLPGFNAEASVYSTSVGYYMGRSPVQDSRSIYPAQQNYCPPWCIQDCLKGCLADGLSQKSCNELCQSDCGAYGSGRPVSCGPCVEGVQTCILCGGATTDISCGPLNCGDHFCPPGDVCCGPGCCPADNPQCCDGHTCCPADAQCCHDGHGCCPWYAPNCANIFGWHFCW
jgi:hypothetical protein